MADEPSTGELERLIERNHRETSADILDLKSQLTSNVTTLLNQFDKYVLAAVYEANERTRNATEQSLKQQVGELRDEVTTARRGNRTAAVAAIFSFLGALALVAFQALIKGGH